ncbi:hypothetical protein BHE90_017532 [Fusarium euwallaceae]|uniref:Uncharacterized protein n=1 Tax=Fusarium euwallaceae TaxID=1147111 RepID=A0A430KX73_9HYPO|nr:hypothetical protein BHE90_017532 [Fusarium euwallaceae]
MSSLAQTIGGVWLDHPQSSWQLRVELTTYRTRGRPWTSTEDVPTALGEVVDDECDGMTYPSLAQKPRKNSPRGRAAKLKG